MTRTLTLIAAAAAIAITSFPLTATDAEAKRGGSRYQQWEFDSSHPIKGYEGFSGGSGMLAGGVKSPCVMVTTNYSRPWIHN